MKNYTFTFLVGFLAILTVHAKLIKSIPFENEKEIQTWPGDCTVELDEEDKVEGAKSIVFTPDNNFCAYIWQRYTAGTQYTAIFRVKAEKPPIARIAFAINFKKADGSPAGTFSKPIKDLVTCDNTWQTAKVVFTCPPEAVRGQTMFAMFRCNTTVFIDDFKLYEGDAAITPVATVPSANKNKRKFLLELTVEDSVPSVTNIREVHQ